MPRSAPAGACGAPKPCLHAILSMFVHFSGVQARLAPEEAEVKPWHALFAPLPADAVPRRKPVLSPELAGHEHADAIAGWDSLIVDLSDPPYGLRTIQVVLDAADRPISASDHVLVRFPDEAAGGAPVRMRQESVGGRLEIDGSFRGTHWDVSGLEPVGDEPPLWQSTPRPPTAEELTALKALVAEIVKRAPRRGNKDQ
jgi:hypothetical protein